MKSDLKKRSKTGFEKDSFKLVNHPDLKNPRKVFKKTEISLNQRKKEFFSIRTKLLCNKIFF